MNKQELLDIFVSCATLDCEHCNMSFRGCENKPRFNEMRDMVISALEKQIPKKPIEEEKQYSEDYGFNSDILCPVCNNYIGYYTEAMCKPEYMQYCNECGQRIDNDWSGEDE